MKRITRYTTLALIAVLLVFGPGGAAAQSDDATQQQLRQQSQDQVRDGAQQHDRDRDQDQTRTHYRDPQHEVLSARIDAATDLTAEEKTAMHKNLETCAALGVSGADLEAVFPGEAGNRHSITAQAMLRLQNRVMTAAREGLPVEPMLAKVQEGRTKGVPEPLLERACERMENQVRTAHQIMNKAVEEGFEPPNDGQQNRRLHAEMAQQMWRGMNEDSYVQIRERARQRLRDGECGVEDLVSAGEVATRLVEAGVKRERATRFAGDALQNGYRVQQMRQLQVMVASRFHRGESMDEFVGGLEHCLGEGMGAGEMYNYMWRHGWMGGGGMPGPGDNPTDDKGYRGGQGGNQGGNGHGGQDGSGRG